jgi:hypothetical protein
VLFVVYTERVDITRIISARKATPGSGGFTMEKTRQDTGLSPEQVEKIKAAQKRHAAIDPGCENLSPEEFITWHPMGGISWEERAQRMQEAGIISPERTHAAVV